ncbi:MAG: BrnA antitoxin family protein [Mesorhizobium sp.]|nr:BrnA antitoxin family protein [Mesorhizobium sp.]
MSENKRDTKPGWIDADDAPELTDEWFESADQHDAGQLVRRGRPPTAVRKTAISLRVDADILEKFRSTGAGWQGRMNEALRKAVGL